MVNGMIEIIAKNIKDLRPYKDNPRQNDSAVEAVAASIREFGFRVPVIVDKDGEIIAGHTRIKAAERLGIETVPTVVADDLTPEQVRAFRLADNKTSELAEWDVEKLEAELAALDGFDMEQFGFDFPEDIDSLDETEAEEPDEDTEPITQPGDIYQLGEHRLVCGDSTDPDTIARLMDGKTADMLLTDPPYNVGYEGKRKTYEGGQPDAMTIENDSFDADNDDGTFSTEFVEFLTAAFRAALSAMKPGAAFYVWYAGAQGLNFHTAAERAGMQIRQILIWVKNTFRLSRQDYQWQHEPCLYGWKDGAAHYFADMRTESTVIEDRPNVNKMSKDDLKKMVLELLEEKTATTVIREPKPAASDEHPTMKPVKLFARLIRNSTRPGELILDTFGGSGTAIVAAEQLGRTCYTVELDPRYCDVIVDRWQKLTNKQAVRISTGTQDGGETHQDTPAETTSKRTRKK